MATINILIAADAGMLAQALADKKLKPGTATSPISLGCYEQSNIPMCMMTEGSIISNMASEEFATNVNSGDTLEWAMSGFNNSDYTVFPYSAAFSPSEAMSGAMCIAPQTTVYYPSTGKPTGPLTAFKMHDYCLQSTVLQTNVTIQYMLCFALVNNSTGKIIGYFAIDAFIVS